MISKLRLVTLFLLLFSSVYAQEIVWERRFDSGDSDTGGDCALDRQGNIIVAGIIGDPMSGSDLQFIKYDSDGNIIWYRTYDFFQGEDASTIATDSLDNIVGVGCCPVGTLLAGLVVKLDSDGDTLWHRTYYGNPGVGIIFQDVVVDAENDILIAGASLDIEEGNILLVKYRENGDLLWAKTHDWGDEEVLVSITLDTCGNIFGTGYIYTPPVPPLISDIIAAEFDSSGDTVWTKRYDFSDSEGGRSINLARSGNIAITGWSGDSSSWGCFTMKCDYDGDTIWTRTFRSPLGKDYGWAITTDSGENVFVSGWGYSESGSIVDSSKFLVLKYDSQGDTVWTSLYSFALFNFAGPSILLDSSHDLIVSGHVGETSGDLLTFKLRDGTGIEESPLNTHSNSGQLFPNQPNPFCDRTDISFQIVRPSFTTLKVYDIAGRVVTTLIEKWLNQGYYSRSWDGTDSTGRPLPSGLYFCILRSDGFAATRKMVLIP